MTKDLAILVIGFGSIGQRHYRTLLNLGYKNVYAYDIDRERIGSDIRQVDNLSRKTLSQFKIAFICTPTHLHSKTGLMCAESRCHIFIEKPLANTLHNLNKLVELCRARNLTTMVGCNLRFDPCLRKIKDLIDEDYLGKIYAIYLEYGRYLPYQRSVPDYRETYAASREMGGGIILDDIHDVDLLCWFNNFSTVKQASFVFDRVSDLEINVEDICNATLRFDNKVIGNIRCDYLQQYKHRNCKIIGEKGNLTWNFRYNAIYHEYFDNTGQEKRIKVFQSRSRLDRMFIDEVKYFLLQVSNSQDTFNNIERSLQTLKLVLAKK